MNKCEECGENNAIYLRDSFFMNKPPLKVCSICAEKTIKKIPRLKKLLNFRRIKGE